MAPPQKHDTDAILDAVRELVLSRGPRAASVAAIAAASGAPVGTLYHRFRSRDGLLAAVWIRALERFQAAALAAAAPSDDPLDRAAGLAGAMVRFAERRPDDARLLLAVRRDDLLDAAPGRSLRDRVDELNRPLLDEVRAIAVACYGKADARSLAAVSRAVVELPYGVVRRYAGSDPFPDWLAGDVAADARRLLEAPRDGAA